MSLSIISWFLIVTSGWAVLYTPFGLDNPVTQQMFQTTGASPKAVLIVGFISGITTVIAGIAMLKRQKWGRQLYLIMTPLVLLLSAALYNFKLIGILLLGFLMYGVFTLLLTRPAVNDYFSNIGLTEPLPSDTPTGSNAQSTTNGKRIASVFLLIPGGLFLATWFLMILHMASNFLALVFMSAFCGILAGAFIIPAIFLWGRKQWVGVLGTLTTCVGGMLLMISLALYSFTTMEGIQEQFAAVDPAFLEQMIYGSLIFGIAGALIGGLLIILQRDKDKQARPTIAGT